MTNHAFILLAFSILLISNISCTREYDYETQAVDEINSGIRHDSLFMGLYLGMSRSAFRDHCGIMNQRKLFQQGNMGLSVEYQLTTLSSPVSMNFYPVFKDDVIVEMPVRFEFNNWSPWNKKSHSDVLIKEVAVLLEKWYDANYHVLTIPSGWKVLVSVEGNRRIILSLEGDRAVRALISDLSAVPYQLDEIHLE
jgi:hypothetical protein